MFKGMQAMLKIPSQINHSLSHDTTTLCYHNVHGTSDVRVEFRNGCKDHFVYASSQWETTSQCTVVSHWLGACTEWHMRVGLCNNLEAIITDPQNGPFGNKARVIYLQANHYYVVVSFFTDTQPYTGDTRYAQNTSQWVKRSWSKDSGEIVEQNVLLIERVLRFIHGNIGLQHFCY